MTAPRNDAPRDLMAHARRRLVAITLVMAAALTAFPATSHAPALAAGPHVRRGAGATPCRFVKTATVWTLRADCATQHTIALPNGVTLDGAGKTMTLNGSARGYADDAGYRAGLLIDGSTGGVRNLALRQHVRGCRGNTSVWAIAFREASGRVEDTTITAVDATPHPNEPCYRGILADDWHGGQVDIGRVTITGLARFANLTPYRRRAIAIEFDGWKMTGTVTNCTIRDMGSGVYVLSVTVTMTDCTMQNVLYGALAFDGGVLTMRDNTINANGGGAASGNAGAGIGSAASPSPSTPAR